MQHDAELEVLLGEALVGALRARGFESLTSVQRAVLAPEVAGRDLRISSQTGSGKTVAIGFAIRAAIAEAPAAHDEGEGLVRRGVAQPAAIIVTPTRELAQQVERELSWLFAPLGAGVVSVTGGASYRDEMRSFASGPRVVVGTPGRLLDHLKRKSLDASRVRAFVLDEADRMLDMGFAEDLEAILANVPEERSTHLVSATFPREVERLARRIQKDAVAAFGTALGQANVDIDHVLYLVDNEQRFDALVNILLAEPDAQTLVFARTRADVATLTKRLSGLGFEVAGLSGEMEQRARNRALAAFKKGELRALIATDVAARGIDVQDIGQVLHFEPPNDADTYTHRSGRTGRAGKKGTSAVLVCPPALPRVKEILRRAGVGHRFEPVPTRASIEAALDARLVAELGAPAPEGGFDEATWSMAQRLTGAGDPAVALARLLVRVAHRGPTVAREITAIEPPAERPRREEKRRDRRGEAPMPPPRGRRASAPTEAPSPEGGAPRGRGRQPPAEGGAAPVERGSWQPPARAPWSAPDRSGAPAPRRGSEGGDRHGGAGGPEWVTFRVTWGEIHGADPRRLLAMVCRRGGIQSGDVGAIRVDRTHSFVDVASDVADGFADSASKRDPRDPRVSILRGDERGARSAGFAQRGAPTHRPGFPFKSGAAQRSGPAHKHPTASRVGAVYKSAPAGKPGSAHKSVATSKPGSAHKSGAAGKPGSAHKSGAAGKPGAPHKSATASKSAPSPATRRAPPSRPRVVEDAGGGRARPKRQGSTRAN